MIRSNDRGSTPPLFIDVMTQLVLRADIGAAGDDEIDRHRIDRAGRQTRHMRGLTHAAMLGEPHRIRHRRVGTAERRFEPMGSLGPRRERRAPLMPTGSFSLMVSFQWGSSSASDDDQRSGCPEPVANQSGNSDFTQFVTSGSA